MIRKAEKKDFGDIRDMLAVEGYVDEEMDFVERLTIVSDDNGVDGFYTVRMENEVPYLVHFCTKRGRRSHALARKLVRSFKNTVRSFGYIKAILGIPNGNDYLKRLASRYFRAVPYAADEVNEYYFAEVSHV